MIIRNNVPNQVWDEAMGTPAFAPQSWRGGGGGLGNYGLAPGSVTDQIMSDVVDGLMRAITDLEAQAYVRTDISAAQRVDAQAVLQQLEGQVATLDGAERANVLAGAETLATWVNNAEGVSRDVAQVSRSLGEDLTDWLAAIIAGARGVKTGGFSKVLLGAGVLVAAFLAYEFMKKKEG